MGDEPGVVAFSGQRFGVYELHECLGAGGMGEVYRARDTRLGRDVAVKILLHAVAADADRLARFEREARILASLNHPNIATIHGVESHQGVLALVMELVEGKTLAAQLARGPMPLANSVRIAHQIADALDAAHAKGVVHRDLKPANVMITAAGVVKVLDFGVAKHVALDASGGPESHTATMTVPATQQGLMVGTVAYMSPEQARGVAVDRRTDVWAFGCVLFEMLTGRPAFARATQPDTVAAVLERDPDWSWLPTATPGAVRRLLRRCLVKDPHRRLRDIGDAKLELEEPGGDVLVHSGTAPRRWRSSAGAIALLLGITAAVAGWAAWSLKPSDSRPVSRLSHVLDQDVSFTHLFGSLVAIAPNGSAIVYVAGNQLYHRALSDEAATPIRGTEGVPSSPFFSPDGEWLGYVDAAAGELRRIAVNGGPHVPLAPAPVLYGANWESDNTIVYALDDGIWRVSANGGVPEQLVKIDTGELTYGPRLLAGGEALLFSLVKRATMVGQATGWDSADVVVQWLASGERRTLVRGSDVRILPTGHMVYALGDVLYAIPFDGAAMEVAGGAVPLVQGVQRAVRGSGGHGGSANYDVSRAGTLVYVPNFRSAGSEDLRLLAVDRSGNADPLIDEPRNYWRPRISSDGGRVLVEVLTGDSRPQIWMVDLKSRIASPLTPRESAYAVWTADGESVIYRGMRGDAVGLYRRAANGSGTEALLLEWPAASIRPDDVSRTGEIVFSAGTPQNIGVLSPKSGTVTHFASSPAREHMASFSPDGKWLAYTSNESGTDEVYVRPFPGSADIARLVSLGGGSGPRWAPDGSRLFYRGASGDLMAVATTLEPRFTTGRPVALFRYAGVYRMSGTATAYDLHPDGKRFIMVSEAEGAGDAGMRQQVNVVLNWHEELERVAPAR